MSGLLDCSGVSGMSRVNVWWPMYPADFAIDTQGLTLEEVGAYVTFLNQYWRTEGKLSGSDAYLARLVGVSPQKWKALRPVLCRFFSVDDKGNWRHERLDAELQKAIDLSEKRRESGRVGGLKTQANAKANASTRGEPETKQVLKQGLRPSPSPSPSPVPTQDFAPVSRGNGEDSGDGLANFAGKVGGP